MTIAWDKGVNSIGGFLKNLTQVEPGYFNGLGGTTLGLTEADRRRLMGIPEDHVEPADDQDDTLAAPDIVGNTDKAGKDSVKMAFQVISNG